MAAVYAVGNMKFSFKRTPMSETDVAVVWIGIYGFIVCMVQGTGKEESRTNFILQNCSVKKGLDQERFNNAELLC
jgi:hypothetical protein